jgi:hypothetical protein
MLYLATREVAIAWLSAPVLLAETQYTQPVHITVGGAKKDPAAQALVQAALNAGPVYKRLEWFDPAEGQLPRADVEYPSLPHLAAFLCTATSCSSPIVKRDVLQSRLHKLAY